MLLDSTPGIDNCQIKVLFWIPQHWSEKHEMSAWCTGLRDSGFLHLLTFNWQFLWIVKLKNSNSFTNSRAMVATCYATDRK